MARLTLIERPEIADAIVDAVRRGVPVHRAARLAGMSPQLLSEWRAVAEGAPNWKDGTPVRPESREKICSLFARLAYAQDQLAQEMVEQIRTAATTVNEKTGLPEWRAADCLLSKHPAFRAEWREERHVEVEHTGQITREGRLVRGIETPKLVDLLPGEWQGLLDAPATDNAAKESSD